MSFAASTINIGPLVETDLVEDYRRRIVARGVEYSADDCWRDYRLGSMHGMLITVVATAITLATTRTSCGLISGGLT